MKTICALFLSLFIVISLLVSPCQADSQADKIRLTEIITAANATKDAALGCTSTSNKKALQAAKKAQALATKVQREFRSLSEETKSSSAGMQLGKYVTNLASSCRNLPHGVQTVSDDATSLIKHCYKMQNP